MSRCMRTLNLYSVTRHYAIGVLGEGITGPTLKLQVITRTLLGLDRITVVHTLILSIGKVTLEL
jgi:hypothetical protein